MDVRHPRGIGIILAHRKKPADETRLFEKLAHSIRSALPFAEIHCLGTRPVSGHPESRMILQGFFSGKPGFLSWLRDGVAFWKYLFLVRPSLLVVASADLYGWAWLWKKVVPSTRLVFDVQENQVLNFRFQQVYSDSLLSRVPHLWRAVEDFFFQHADSIWLAEEVYPSQLGILGTPVLANKVPQIWETCFPQAPTEPLFLFSGVLTEEAGIREVVDEFLKIRSAWPQARLQVVGFAPDPRIQLYLSDLSRDPDKGISLVGGNAWVPSAEVAEAVSKAFVVWVGYRESPANAGKHPTKMYEAAYFQKPVMLKPESHFWSFAESLGRVLAWKDPDKDPGFIRELKELWAEEKARSAIKRPDCRFEEEKVAEVLNVIFAG